jgi:hypothetical protein
MAASCSVSMGVTWHEADHSCPFTVVLRVCVCVELNLHSPEGLPAQEQLYRYQIALKTLN